MNLFGACSVRSSDPAGFSVTGAKHRGLFALLATAPFGRRTRSFLQETLWGTSCYDAGRQNLRRALTDLKQILGEAYSGLIAATHTDVTLALGAVDLVGRPGHGLFLEGLDIREKGFEAWRDAIRANPSQLYPLYSLHNRLPVPAILPLVAVLPFRALAPEPGDAVMGDWLAEEICRSLSRSRLITVISHLSCRQLDANIISLAKIRETLATDYCLTGSLRRAGSDIIVDADLIDTANGHILWTRQLSCAASHFTSSSAPGIADIVRSVGTTIAKQAIAHISGRAAFEVDDHRLLIAAVSLMHRATLQEFNRSRDLIDEALRRAPMVAETHAWMAKWHVLAVFNGWSANAGEDSQRAMDCTARALDISPDNAFCLTIDGFAHNNLHRRLDVAAERYNAALGYNPNEPLSWLLKGTLDAFRDDGPAAVSSSEHAQRLSPLDPFGYFYDSLSATAYFANEQYDKALACADRSIRVNNRHLSTLRTRIAALHHLDRAEEARRAATELMRRQPDFSVAAYVRNHPAAEFDVGQRVISALKQSGIP